MESMFEIPFRNSKPSEDRMKVLTVSVVIEQVVNVCLSRQLGLMEPKLTRSFGNSSQSLSFNAKLNLFLDLKGINKEDVDILTKYSYIRNKFAHLAEIQTIFDCLQGQTDNSIRKYFEKHYAERIESYEYSEEKVREAFMFFLDDVENTCSKIMNDMFDKIIEETAVLVKSKKQEILLKNFLNTNDFSDEEKLFVRKILMKTKKETSEYDFTDEILALI